MNVAMPIAAVHARPGLSGRASSKAVPILARTAGLLAHLAEEQEVPLGFLMAGAAEEAVEYQPGRPRLVMLAPEVETRPWAEQLRARRRRLPRPSSTTSSSARPSTARSSPPPAFAPAGGGRAGRDRAAAAHRQAGAEGDLHARESDRSPPLRGAVRARPDLLDERNHRRAELRAADGGRPRELGRPARRAATPRRASRPASASSPPTTPGRSSPARRLRPSSASASATSRSAPGTPSG